MRILLAMVGKDLRRRLRAPLATVLLLLFPVLFSAIIALTFGGSEAKVPKVRLLIDDRDGGLIGGLVVSAFQQGDAQKYFEVKKIAADNHFGDAALIEHEEATAILRLPAKFSDDVMAGRPARIELVKSPAQSILPDVAEQVTAVLADGLSSASRLLREPLDRIRTSPATPQGAVSDQRVAEISVLINGVINRARPYVLPPVITLDTATAPGSAPRRTPGTPAVSIFLLVLPGISVYALFNLADQTMRDLLVEARLKTLRRQLAGPVTAGRIVAAKALATAAVASLSLLILTTIGALVARRGVSLAGYLLLSGALVAAATGFSSAVFGMSRGERQGATLATLLSLVMAFTGGAFIPLNSLPSGLRALSPFSPMYWASSGYVKLVLDGGGLRSVLPHIGILAGMGIVLLLVSAPLWQRRLLRGDLA